MEEESDSFTELPAVSNGSFMLQNGMKFDNSDSDWCLTAESFEPKATLHMRPCAGTENMYLLQWFFYDDTGRMRLSVKPEFCLRWSGKVSSKSEKSWKSAKSGKKQPFFDTCDDESSAIYKFKFVDGSIQAIGYGRPDTAWFLGIRPGEKKFKALRLFKAENSRDLNESLGMWIMIEMSDSPSSRLTDKPSALPSLLPTNAPSVVPSASPSDFPSVCRDEPGWRVGGPSSNTYSAWTCLDVENSEFPQEICATIDALHDQTYDQKRVRYNSFSYCILEISSASKYYISLLNV